MKNEQDFEAFWKKFLSDHPSRANRWAHVAALVVGTSGLVISFRKRSLRPVIVGLGAAAGFAVGGHPVFQGDHPKNFGRPIWAARAFLRLCVRTVTGRADEELAEMEKDAMEDASHP